MNQEALIKRIKAKAKQDQRFRRDPRFLETMGFLVAKGFLKTNLDIQLTPNIRLQIDDVIWAGQNVEPRILEVLPAAVLRLEKHFDLDPTRHIELARVVDQLRRRDEKGDDFENMPYAKVRVWAEFPLKDKRVKSITQKRVMKSFRLDPTAIQKLKKIAHEKGCSETEVIEELLK